MRRVIGLLAALIAAWLAWGQPAMAAGTIKIAVPSNLNTFDPAKTKIGEEYIVNCGTPAASPCAQVPIPP